MVREIHHQRERNRSMNNTGPDQDFNRRHSDSIVIALSQKFNDFVERYDRDCGTNSEWRRTVELKIEKQSELLNEISPAYTKGKWIIGLIVVGSVAIAVKAFWDHIFFR